MFVEHERVIKIREPFFLRGRVGVIFPKCVILFIFFKSLWD